jgi:hypothetical protein
LFRFAGRHSQPSIKTVALSGERSRSKPVLFAYEDQRRAKLMPGKVIGAEVYARMRKPASHDFDPSSLLSSSGHAGFRRRAATGWLTGLFDSSSQAGHWLPKGNKRELTVRDAGKTIGSE